MRIHKPVRTMLLLLGTALVASAAAAPKLSTQECLACHSDNSLTKEVNGKQVSLYVNEEHYKGSIHSMFGCTDCHKDIAAFPHEPAQQKPQCVTCHAEQQAAYDRGFHAAALKKGDANAANCQSCHGNIHEILPVGDEKSPVNHANVPKTCGSCHGQKFVMAASGHTAQQYLSYQESVHGQAVANGDTKAAVCTDCHGAHEILGARDAKSPIAKFNVPATCAKCHENVRAEFMASIHGQALQRGNWQAPVCTDCHGIHSIKTPRDAKGRALPELATNTCASCHEGVRLTREFGVESGRASTYLASYHGLASKLGSTIAANCASCHGTHNILAPSDPKSSVNQANLTKTCGQCHPGAGARFVLGKVHVDAPLSADIGSIAVRWVRKFYLAMILGTIGFMLLHNLLIWWWKARRQRRHLPHTAVTVIRMDRHQRLQHQTLLVSFIILVITGFALKYPESVLASITGGEAVRGVVHRLAGAVLIGVSLYHLVYIAVSRHGRQLVNAMLPRLNDATDVVGTLKYYLGISPERPQYPRFSYGEKLEYWALVWGMFVMAATGLALWFKVGIGNLMPPWWLDVVTAIHFYEAVLATLAIVVWHFYMVIFDPDVYPMNWSWIDGKVNIEHYTDEHGLDRETIGEAIAQAAERNVEPQEASPTDAPKKEV